MIFGAKRGAIYRWRKLNCPSFKTKISDTGKPLESERPLEMEEDLHEWRSQPSDTTTRKSSNRNQFLDTKIISCNSN